MKALNIRGLSPLLEMPTGTPFSEHQIQHSWIDLERNPSAKKEKHRQDHEQFKSC